MAVRSGHRHCRRDSGRNDFALQLSLQLVERVRAGGTHRQLVSTREQLRYERLHAFLPSAVRRFED